MLKLVKRGYITRFNSKEFWEVELHLVPKGVELFDSDAIPYYLDKNDGNPLTEYYGHYSPSEYDVYSEDPYEYELTKYPQKSEWRKKFEKKFNIL